MILCNRNFNCNVAGDLNGPHDGCKLHVKFGEMSIETDEWGPGSMFKVHIPVDDLYSNMPASVGGNCDLPIGKKQNGAWLYATVGVSLQQNPNDGHTEVYVGWQTLDIHLNGLQIKGNCALAGLAGGVKGVIQKAVDSIGGLTCRACQTNSDCGAGSWCGAGKVCATVGGFWQDCAGFQLGAELKVDAAPLLGAIDPNAEGLLGVSAYLGSYNHTNLNGLQLGGRLGGKAEKKSLCVPPRPSPITEGLDDCRSGDNCEPLSLLNEAGTIRNPATGTQDPFHIGVGVAMSGLNQVLWSAYESGVLCLSVGGELEGLEILSTDLFGSFVGSLSSLTYNTDQPIMLQLRPQQAPVVEFVTSETQGAEMLVTIPELEIDFYTIVDHRYARVFTLRSDLQLPLTIKGESNNVEIAIGDLSKIFDPAKVVVSNVEMLTQSQVESLVNNLPSLFGVVAGGITDGLIPPIEIPEFSGINIKFVGPGLTIIEENDLPAALGLFLNMGLNIDNLPSGARTAMEPVVTRLDFDIREPRELRADISARQRAGESFSYRDLMPKIVAQMGVTGVDYDASEIEFAYSINNEPWSYWQRGPALVIDNPRLAAEDKYDIRVTARVASDASTGSSSHATFSFVNDFTEPKVTLEADGSMARWSESSRTITSTTTTNSRCSTGSTVASGRTSRRCRTSTSSRSYSAERSQWTSSSWIRAETHAASDVASARRIKTRRRKRLPPGTPQTVAARPVKATAASWLSSHS